MALLGVCADCIKGEAIDTADIGEFTWLPYVLGASEFVVRRLRPGRSRAGSRGEAMIALPCWGAPNETDLAWRMADSPISENRTECFAVGKDCREDSKSCRRLKDGTRCKSVLRMSVRFGDGSRPSVRKALQTTLASVY